MTFSTACQELGRHTGGVGEPPDREAAQAPGASALLPACSWACATPFWVSQLRRRGHEELRFLRDGRLLWDQSHREGLFK